MACICGVSKCATRIHACSTPSLASACLELHQESSSIHVCEEMRWLYGLIANAADLLGVVGCTCLGNTLLFKCKVQSVRKKILFLYSFPYPMFIPAGDGTMLKDLTTGRGNVHVELQQRRFHQGSGC